MSDWISERCLHNVTGDGDYICGRFGETPSRCSSSTISMTLEYSFFFFSIPSFVHFFSLSVCFSFLFSWNQRCGLAQYRRKWHYQPRYILGYPSRAWEITFTFFFLTLQVKIRADCVVDWLEVSRQSPKQKANKWNWMKTIAEMFHQCNTRFFCFYTDWSTPWSPVRWRKSTRWKHLLNRWDGF